MTLYLIVTKPPRYTFLYAVSDISIARNCEQNHIVMYIIFEFSIFFFFCSNDKFMYFIPQTSTNVDPAHVCMVLVLTM